MRQTKAKTKKKAVGMKKERFDRLMASAREAVAYARGQADGAACRTFVASQIDVPAIRHA